MLDKLFAKSVQLRLVVSFAALIFSGSLLLSLPISQLATSQATYFDHLFTSVSMVCVTGLSTTAVSDTYTHFGQIICMILMQLGGLGLMSLVAFIVYNFGRRISFVDQMTLQEGLNRDDASNFKDFLFSIFRYTFSVELIATAIFSIRFVPLLGWKQGIFSSLFLAISAFCNAGFDNFGSSSLQNYAHDPLVVLTVAGLIILGGLGFSVWFDIRRNFQEFRKSKGTNNRRPFYKRLSYHTRVVLTTTAGILLMGTISTLATEFRNVGTIGNFTFMDKIMTSFFQSVTMRTAGFATIDYTKANPISLLIYCVQMFIGGSPGGTAGGIKTTTFLIVMVFLLSVIRGHRYSNFKSRTFSLDLIRKSLVVFVLFVSTFILGLAFLTITDPQVPFLHLTFESMSALGTVGVSANLTPHLTRYGQTILMMLMFIGRLGPLTLLIGLSRQDKKHRNLHLAEAQILVG
ncbi:TrkH family potassium uptake protein [Granulicatella seriolae]|uniref:Potassium transporter n=1 Tax=Granulicatella seriolae TaxID=2967226 RepID=A0ABT1WPR6_9LACT|nr:potassium transporter TrkG [Granulicatella seriolae]